MTYTFLVKAVAQNGSELTLNHATEGEAYASMGVLRQRGYLVQHAHPLKRRIYATSDEVTAMLDKLELVAY